MIRNSFWEDESIPVPDLKDLSITQQELIKPMVKMTLQMQLEMQTREETDENTPELF